MQFNIYKKNNNKASFIKYGMDFAAVINNSSALFVLYN